jgi:hypothetical protein
MTLHTKLSYAKSGVRILGYACLIVVGIVQSIPGLWIGGGLLLLAEILGIAEEAWPGAYKGTETTEAPFDDSGSHYSK